MWNNFVYSLALLAQLTGLTLPDIISAEWYLAPSYTEQNIYYQVAEKIEQPEIKNISPAPIKITDDPGPENLQAQAALVIDQETGKILWQKNSEAKLAIASLTKLMTALVWFKHQPLAGMEHLHTLAPVENNLIGARLQVDNGDKVRAFDLLRATLVGSMNNAASALVHSTEMPQAEFVAKMNREAQALGLQNTIYTDPTGLSAGNQSTAVDLVKLFQIILQYPDLAVPMGMSEHLMETMEQKKELRIKNTNILLKDPDLQILAGKTGYITEAGYCLMVLAKNDQGKQIIAVVLGEPSETSRISEMKELIQWTFNNYQWN